MSRAAILALMMKALAVVLLANPSAAPCLAATLAFSPTHDARVESSNAGSNYGSSSLLRIRSSSAVNSYLKFNITGVSGTVINAKLRLYCVNASVDGGRVYLVSNNYLGTSTPWVEGGLNWNNAPTIGGTALDQKGAVTVNTWVEFNVTPALVGNGAYTFGLSSGSTDTGEYSSKDAGSNPPELVIETALPPTIASFSPSFGPVGTEVTLVGSGFTGVTAVNFDNITAGMFTVDSDTHLRTTAPPGATAGPIQIFGPGGTATTAGDFAVTAPPMLFTFPATHDARVNSSNPTSNYGSSTPLRVRSSGPTYNSYLKFNATGLTGIVVRARLRLYCADASADGGRVYLVSNNYLGTSTPWVEGGLNWNNAPAIGGTALDQETAVPLDTWIEFDVTSAIAGNGIYSFGLSSGSTDVAGYNAKEVATNVPELVIESPPPPAITSFSPAIGPPGTVVAIAGANFLGATAVNFNGVAAASFTTGGDTSLTATVPATGTTGPIHVVGPGGTGTSSGSFTVLPSTGTLWTSAAELATKPMSGPAWDAVLAAADTADRDTATVWDQDSNNNVAILAAGIAFARTGDVKYRNMVYRACDTLVARGYPSGRTLAWGRESGAYVMAADLAGYRTSAFESWLRNLAEVWRGTEGNTLLEVCLEVPNNWGAHAFGSLTAIYAYLGDWARLDEIRDHWTQSVVGPDPGLDYSNDLTWHADSTNLHMINPAGATIQGLNVDGIIPEDMQRGGPFQIPPLLTNYPWEHLQGLVMAARILERRGLPIWNVGDDAIHRAAYALQVRLEFAYGGWKASGDERWLLPFLDKAYGTDWTVSETSPRVWKAGKNAGWAYVVSSSVPLAVEDPSRLHSPEVELGPVVPSPLRERGTITFDLARAAVVDLRIVDLAGRLVRVLAAGSYSGGRHRVELHTSDLKSGVYFARLAAGGSVHGLKVLIVH